MKRLGFRRQMSQRAVSRRSSGRRGFEPLESRQLLAVTVMEELSFTPAVEGSMDQPTAEMHVLFAPNTPGEVVERYEQRVRDSASGSPIGTYQADSRWGRTATDGGGLSWGDATTITWSIVPDGTAIAGFIGEPAGGSNFVSFMNGIYGSGAGAVDQQPWFPLVASVFDTWSDLSGITFVYESSDDGAAFSQNPFNAPGQRNVRGDIRIGGHAIDGDSGTLAYNFFPDNGEMILDTADSFYHNTANSWRTLRNVMAHELGHGLGLNHVEPVTQTKLMEPFLSTTFDGPQHDDILAVHRLYGDIYEARGGNDDPATATVVIPNGNQLVLGASSNGDYVSIDGAADIDVYRFSASAGTTLDLLLDPLGYTYQQGPQGGGSSSFDSDRQNDLRLELLDSRLTILATAESAGLGSTESLQNITLPDGGDFYLRVSGDRDAAQLYQLNVELTAPSGDPPPEDPPPEDPPTQHPTGINFSEYRIDSYGGAQDVWGSATIENGGATLRLAGNSWKKIDLPYQITSNTVLEFDFQSNRQGEVHGIGFDDDTNISSALTFQVYGTQDWGYRTYRNYDLAAPGTQHYRIPVGQYYTGQAANLFFTNDHDVSSPTAESVFSNVRIYEDDGQSTGGAPSAANDSATVFEDTPTVSLDVLTNDDRGESSATITRLGSPSAGGKVAVNPDQTISYQPKANFFGTETFSYTIANAAGESTARVSVTVRSVNDRPTAVADSFQVASNSQQQILSVLDNDSASPDLGETLTITSASSGSAGGTVAIEGNQILYTPRSGYQGTETFQYTINDGTPGSDATATVTVQVAEPNDVINFMSYWPTGYGGRQDASGTVTIDHGGRTLRLAGNRWQKVDLPYQITENTVLEFNFQSSRQGEVHGIGFDDDTNISSALTFQVYGTQSWGIGDYRTYAADAPDVTHFVIPVGQYYRGQAQYLFFANDHDVSSPFGESVFSDVRVYEYNYRAGQIAHRTVAVSGDEAWAIQARTTSGNLSQQPDATSADADHLDPVFIANRPSERGRPLAQPVAWQGFARGTPWTATEKEDAQQLRKPNRERSSSEPVLGEQLAAIDAAFDQFGR